MGRHPANLVIFLCSFERWAKLRCGDPAVETGQKYHGNVYQFQKALIKASFSLHQKGVTFSFWMPFYHGNRDRKKKKRSHGKNNAASSGIQVSSFYPMLI